MRRWRIVFISSAGGRMAVPLVGPGPTATGSSRGMQTMIDDMEAGMSPGHRELYSRHTAGLRRVGRLDSRANAPDAVARVVERALTARRPRARYLAGADAHALVAMSAVLPTRLGDAVGARIGGLTSTTTPAPAASTDLPEPAQGQRRA